MTEMGMKVLERGDSRASWRSEGASRIITAARLRAFINNHWHSHRWAIDAATTD